jgi:hypothetical protein
MEINKLQEQYLTILKEPNVALRKIKLKKLLTTVKKEIISSSEFNEEIKINLFLNPIEKC